MNASTVPSCIACFFHAKCGNCATEAHKVRGSEPNYSAYRPIEAARPDVSPGEGSTSHVNPSDHFDVPPTPSVDDSSKHIPQLLNSYTASGVTAPEQLELQQLHMQDVHLARLQPDGELSESTNKSTIAVGSPENLASSSGHHDQQVSSKFSTPSSGRPTPASDRLDYWDDSPCLTGSAIGSETLLEIFRGPLETLFQDWLAGVQHHGNGREKSPSGSSSSLACSSSHERPQPKRNRVDDDNGEGDNGPSKSRGGQKRSRKLLPLHELLACPYFKKDARRHRACCGFGFKKLSYVKTHIYQKHAIAIYCPVCQQPFESVQLRDSHTRQRRCEPVENDRAPDGITSEQRDWLGRRGPRGLTEEQQWFRIFEFLFPGHPRPHSVYDDTEFSEDVLNFNDYITGSTGLEVLLQRARENPLWTAELEAGLREDIEYGLGQFYWRWATTNRSEIGQTPASDTPPRGPVTSSQSTTEGTSSASTESETILDENNASPVQEATAQDVSEGTGSTAVASLEDEEEDEEPRLESAPAFADFELEDRKVDEEDQMGPRQLNHEGIATIVPLALWAPAGPSEIDIIDYEPLSLPHPNEIQFGNSELDALLNPGDEIARVELWTANLVLIDGILNADGVLGEFEVNAVEDAPAAPDDGSKGGSGGRMDSP